MATSVHIGDIIHSNDAIQYRSSAGLHQGRQKILLKNLRRYSNAKSFINNYYKIRPHTGNRRTIRVRSNRTPVASSWTYDTFKRRECVRFVPSPTGDIVKCICGRTQKNHKQRDPTEINRHLVDWSASRNTKEIPTNAVGTLEFQGTGEGDKAQFIRISDNTTTANTIRLLTKEWELELPKLVITGIRYEMNMNMKIATGQRQIIGSGLIRATRTTEAWIMSIGLHSGVGELVGSALHEHQLTRRGRIRAIAVAPWGIVDNREGLEFHDSRPSGPIPYQTMADPLSKGSVLNTTHTHFLLADNGTVGYRAWNSELKFRRTLEKDLVKKHKVPMVCLVVEGDKTTIETVQKKVAESIPVVVCAGTGHNRFYAYGYGQARNAADLIAFAHTHSDSRGSFTKEFREDLRLYIHEWLPDVKPEEIINIILTISRAMENKQLIKIFRMDLPGAGSEKSLSIDHAILTALFNNHRKADPDEWLKMAMTWDRADIARTYIFAFPHAKNFRVGSLERRLEEALLNDRVEFVKLLMENGVSMHKFLTYKRLEDLYNQPDKPDHLPQHLKYLFDDVISKAQRNQEHKQISLINVGHVIELLMGGTYRAQYTRKRFRLYYETTPEQLTDNNPYKTFEYPFHELLIWAILMKRQEMAIFMWQQGEEALAKALVAMKLYRRMAQEADDDDINQEEIKLLRTSADVFKERSLELLKLGFKESEKMCYQLLTYELKTWSRHTCLSLAVLAQHRDLIAHPCVQNIISDLWMGGMDLRRNSNIKVPMSLLVLPFLALSHVLPSQYNYSFIKFKTHEQLLQQPQTMQEYLDECEELDPGMSTRYNETSTSSSSTSSGDEATHEQLATAERNSVKYTSPKNVHNGKIRGKSARLETSETLIPTLTPTVHFDSSSRSHLHEHKTSFSINEKLLLRTGDLEVSRKVYEYFNAPITKYWFNVFVYAIFLLCFSYVILLETCRRYIWKTEWFVIIYIITFAIENLRTMVFSTPRGILAKFKNWHSNFWNAMETIGIIMFFIGLLFRSSGIFIEGVSSTEYMNQTVDRDELLYNYIGYGRALYCIDVVIWFTRLFKFCCVHKKLGPYVTMAGKMMVDMTSFIIILLVVLISFGVCRQSIIYNGVKHWSWEILWNITHEPYFMLYGEVYAYTIDPCNEENKGLMCNPGAWIVPVMMTIYLLVANILLLNLLIAVFNNTFARTEQESNQIWACQRYEVIMQYEAHPIFPPPFILFCHLKMIFDKCSGRRKKGRFRADRGLKLFLNENEEENLHDWEEDLVDDYYRLKRREDGKRFEEQMKASADKIIKIERHLNEVEMRDNHIRSTVFDMSARIMRIEEIGINGETRSRRLNQNPAATEDTTDSNSEEKDNLPNEGARAKKYFF